MEVVTVTLQVAHRAHGVGARHAALGPAVGGVPRIASCTEGTILKVSKDHRVVEEEWPIPQLMEM